MSKSTDPSFLSKNQYCDSSNLSARANLHQKYSTNPISWHQWLFEQLDLPSEAKLLEIGCGPGYLWRENTQSLSLLWSIFLSDLSEGMLEEAQEALGGNSSISCSIIDALDISFPESIFDAVIANHMLYHVSDLSRTLTEIKRVLKPGGCLYAATNGSSHLKEIRSWKSRFFPNQKGSGWGTISDKFGLENGEDHLQELFSEVQLILYPDQLNVTEIEPIIRYIQSYTETKLDPESLRKIRDFLTKMIRKNGWIQITKETGLFIAIKH
jgi:ubiquinone/menaquinone biosynthesis C-methylase UbiE